MIAGWWDQLYAWARGLFAVIGFRYHIVSLVAVLLAVALGVLLGTTQLSGAIGDDQKAQVRSLAKDNGDLQAQLKSATALTRSDDSGDHPAGAEARRRRAEGREGRRAGHPAGHRRGYGRR